MNDDAASKPRSHFAERCVKYGIVSINGDNLKHRLENDPYFSDRTMRLSMGRTLRCFTVNEGTFYAVFDDGSGIVVTLYTQEMVNRVKRRNKRRKRTRSHKHSTFRH